MANICFLSECKTNKLKVKRLRVKHFVRFPSNEDVRKKWLKLIGRPDATIGATSLLCVDHFKRADLLHRFRSSNVTNVPPRVLPFDIASSSKNAELDVNQLDESSEEVVSQPEANASPSEANTTEDDSSVRRSSRKFRAKIAADGEPYQKLLKINVKTEPNTSSQCGDENESSDDTNLKIVKREVISPVQASGDLKDAAIETVCPETTSTPAAQSDVKQRSRIVANRKSTTINLTKKQFPTLIENVKTKTVVTPSPPLSTYPIQGMGHVSETSNTQPIVPVALTKIGTGPNVVIATKLTPLVKKKIVVNAQNIQMIKNALANKKVLVNTVKSNSVTASGLSPQVQNAPTSAVPAAIPPNQPYPVKLISFQPTSSTSTTISDTKVVKPLLTPIRLIPKAQSKSGIIINPNNKAVPPLAITIAQPPIITPKPITDLLSSPISNAQPNIKPQITNTPARDAIDLTASPPTTTATPTSDLHLDLNFTPDNCHLLKVNQRVMKLARVVTALRDELAKHKKENQFLRHQNARIIENNQKLIALMGLKKQTTAKTKVDNDTKATAISDKSEPPPLVRRQSKFGP